MFPNIEVKEKKKEGTVEEKTKPSTEDEGTDNREEDMKDEDQEEVRQPKGVQGPWTPSRKEVEEHNLTHWPYRSWCIHCLKGKARSLPHRRVRISAEERGVPLIAADYM